jgi:hypothetical protein
MKSKTPEKFEKLFPNDYWLLVPWRFYVWHPHQTSRDRSRFLRMILFINNTKNTFYETKVLKTKHVSFFKYIYNALLISYRTFGPVSLRILPVQHKIYRSWSIGPVPISTAGYTLLFWWHWYCISDDRYTYYYSDGIATVSVMTDTHITILMTLALCQWWQIHILLFWWH